MKVEFKDGEGFYPKLFLNCFFIVISFGLYLPWGMTEIRKEIWARTTLNGERFYYLGKVKELIFGYLLLLAIVLLSKGVQYSVPYFFSTNYFLITVASIFGSVIFFTVLYKAKLGSFRYQVNRSVYKGIRFSTDLGDLSSQYKTCLKWGAITFVTLGLAFPYFMFQTDIKKYNSLRYGSEKFNFSMDFSDYMGIVFKHSLILIGLFLAAIAAATAAQYTFGEAIMQKSPAVIISGIGILVIAIIIYMFFLSSLFVNLFRKKIESLSSQNISFSTDITVQRAVKYHLINALILLVTFGLGFPIALANNIKLYSNTITVIGFDSFVSKVGADDDENKTSTAFDDMFSDSFSLDILDAL
jgi:uncharacterized membrane protein YjgN (DUF898 family)